DGTDKAIFETDVGVTTDFYPPTVAASINPAGNAPLVATTAFRPNAQMVMIASDPSGLSSFTLSMDGSAPVSLLGLVNASGGLPKALSDVGALAGKPLTEGAHTIVLAAADRFHNASPNVTVTFSIDTTPPAVPPRPVLVLAGDTTLTGGLINQSAF